MPKGVNAKEFVAEPARLCFVWGVADWSTPTYAPPPLLPKSSLLRYTLVASRLSRCTLFITMQATFMSRYLPFVPPLPAPPLFSDCPCFQSCLRDGGH